MPSRSEVITPARARHLLDREPGEDLDAAAVALAHRYDTVVSLYGHVPCPTDGAGGRRAATPGWPPPAAATSSPASSPACCPGAPSRRTPAGPRSRTW